MVRLSVEVCGSVQAVPTKFICISDSKYIQLGVVQLQPDCRFGSWLNQRQPH